MTTSFPHVDLPALKVFAISTAAALHPRIPAPARRGKKMSRPQVVKPIVVKCEDVIWAGEQVLKLPTSTWLEHTEISINVDDSHYLCKLLHTSWSARDVGSFP